MVGFCRADSDLSTGLLWSHLQLSFHDKQISSKKNFEPSKYDKHLADRVDHLNFGVTFHALLKGIFYFQSQNFRQRPIY